MRNAGPVEGHVARQARPCSQVHIFLSIAVGRVHSNPNVLRGLEAASVLNGATWAAAGHGAESTSSCSARQPAVTEPGVGGLERPLLRFPRVIRMNTPNTNEFNPYAAPSADTNFAPGPQVGAQSVGSYYAMSVAKLWIMSIVTFGLYNIVFFYRHFRHLRDHQQQDVSPFWRAVFSPFMYFGLNSQVSDAVRFSQVPVPALLGVAPWLYLAANAVGRVLDRMSDEGSAGATLLTFALVPVATYAITTTQTAANGILEREGYNGPVNSGATAGSIVMGILCGLMWIFGLLGIFMEV